MFDHSQVRHQCQNTKKYEVLYRKISFKTDAENTFKLRAWLISTHAHALVMNSNTIFFVLIFPDSCISIYLGFQSGVSFNDLYILPRKISGDFSNFWRQKKSSGGSGHKYRSFAAEIKRSLS